MVQINIAKFMIDSSFEINLQGISIVESFHGATAEPQYNAITYLKCEFNSRVYISIDYIMLSWYRLHDIIHRINLNS